MEQSQNWVFELTNHDTLSSMTEPCTRCLDFPLLSEAGSSWPTITRHCHWWVRCLTAALSWWALLVPLWQNVKKELKNSTLGICFGFLQDAGHFMLSTAKIFFSCWRNLPPEELFTYRDLWSNLSVRRLQILLFDYSHLCVAVYLFPPSRHTQCVWSVG